MKNSVSERSFYMESDDEDDDKFIKQDDDDNDDDDDDDNVDDNDDDDGDNVSDSSQFSTDHRQQNKPNSYTTSWPQSYRQSIDMLSSVQSPSIGFLGTPTLSRLGSSFLSSSLLRRHTPEVLPGLIKPLLPTVVVDDDQQRLPPKRRSSLTLNPSRKSSVRQTDASFKASQLLHEVPIRRSTFSQAVLNGMNVLCGVGILSTPYAVKQGGWTSLTILFLFAILSFYTGLLLRHCLDSESGLETYPDIGQAAFGTTGRIVISIILYVELYASCVEYIILESDNLSSLFPNAHLSLGMLQLDSHRLFALISTLAVLPTVWLRDLSVLSYLSAGGVIASILVVLSLFWVGTVDHVNIHTKGNMINLSKLPVVLGLYGFCYSGHAVFPNIYTSMEKPQQFSMVLLTSFGICTLMYAGVAVMGYIVFGELTESQFTLNMPNDLLASKIAVWTTVINPFTKYALTITPVALSLEELIPSNHLKSHIYSILIRTTLVISTLLVGLSIPFFGLVQALIGSFLTMLVTLILPCLCYLSILKGKITRLQVCICTFIIAVGVISSGFGTYSAVSNIIHSLG